MALLISCKPSSISNISFPFILEKNQTSCKSTKMGSFSSNNISCCVSTSSISTVVAQRKLPILLFDVMDTIVHDPFYHDVPNFLRQILVIYECRILLRLRMPMKELLECKHPTAWIEFEKGLITEEELTRKFFKDGRSVDMEGLKNCMRRGYSYLEGVEGLLNSLKENGYEIHAFTNYPIWYQMIEDKLKLSNYLSWTFCSCMFGKRKPDPDFYSEVVKHLGVEASNCIFVDDRMRNVEAAIELGLKGLQFENADLLRKDLSLLGVDISTNESQELTECSS
ncbi:flavin mononucleotide hydrolase 1, chloroplatic isoform X5 [Capsicum annuum]|uniref:flavin mononucleotide hydrolase 1, chloroplatic isoform X5 n=1 Tax=Capsicum annuum TaxID=4072 RepID=UPI001FB14677|nr:flavin mononucleotide hydrolase 1, chloroplatic isoform X5 [Capsicum annuum]